MKEEWRKKKHGQSIEHPPTQAKTKAESGNPLPGKQLGIESESATSSVSQSIEIHRQDRQTGKGGGKKPAPWFVGPFTLQFVSNGPISGHSLDPNPAISLSRSGTRSRTRPVGRQNLFLFVSHGFKHVANTIEKAITDDFSSIRR